MHAVEAPPNAGRFIPATMAVIAVLAALSTLFTHHRSILALAAKNKAILTQSRATDYYTSYESKQVRYDFYNALLASDLVRKAQVRAYLSSASKKQQEGAERDLNEARALEAQADRDDERSEIILKSYEVLQFGTTMFEVSIILMSISALARARVFVGLGCGLSTVGLGFFVFGLLQAH
jgi:predicted ribosome quality control (RQC) complex YloA/Tae2 family protein